MKITAFHYGITLDVIPKDFRAAHKLLGRGATSLVFERDERSVYVVTPSRLKSEWQQHHLKNFGLQLDSDHHTTLLGAKRTRLGDDINAYIMPRMYKLDTQNLRKVTKIIEQFGQAYQHADLAAHMQLSRGKIPKHYLARERIAKLELWMQDHDPDSILHQLILFLMDYDEDLYNFDLQHSNFMQTHEGKLVLVDPIIEPDLVAYHYDGDAAKYKQGRR